MKKSNYPPEIRVRAVELVIESEKDYSSNWAVITAIGLRLVALLKLYVFGIKNI